MTRPTNGPVNLGTTTAGPSATDPAAPSPAAPWARQGGRADKPVTPRARRIVEDLPAWDPLPPGEITVHRPRHG